MISSKESDIILIGRRSFHTKYEYFDNFLQYSELIHYSQTGKS